MTDISEEQLIRYYNKQYSNIDEYNTIYKFLDSNHSFEFFVSKMELFCEEITRQISLEKIEKRMCDNFRDIESLPDFVGVMKTMRTLFFKVLLRDPKFSSDAFKSRIYQIQSYYLRLCYRFCVENHASFFHFLIDSVPNKTDVFGFLIHYSEVFYEPLLSFEKGHLCNSADLFVDGSQHYFIDFFQRELEADNILALKGFFSLFSWIDDSLINKYNIEELFLNVLLNSAHEIQALYFCTHIFNRYNNAKLLNTLKSREVIQRISVIAERICSDSDFSVISSFLKKLRLAEFYFSCFNTFVPLAMKCFQANEAFVKKEASLFMNKYLTLHRNIDVNLLHDILIIGSKMSYEDSSQFVSTISTVINTVPHIVTEYIRDLYDRKTTASIINEVSLIFQSFQNLSESKPIMNDLCNYFYKVVFIYRKEYFGMPVFLHLINNSGKFLLYINKTQDVKIMVEQYFHICLEYFVEYNQFPISTNDPLIETMSSLLKVYKTIPFDNIDKLLQKRDYVIPPQLNHVFISLLNIQHSSIREKVFCSFIEPLLRSYGDYSDSLFSLIAQINCSDCPILVSNLQSCLVPDLYSSINSIGEQDAFISSIINIYKTQNCPMIHWLISEYFSFHVLTVINRSLISYINPPEYCSNIEFIIKELETYLPQELDNVNTTVELSEMISEFFESSFSLIMRYESQIPESLNNIIENLFIIIFMRVKHNNERIIKYLDLCISYFKSPNEKFLMENISFSEISKRHEYRGNSIRGKLSSLVKTWNESDPKLTKQILSKWNIRKLLN